MSRMSEERIKKTQKPHLILLLIVISVFVVVNAHADIQDFLGVWEVDYARTMEEASRQYPQFSAEDLESLSADVKRYMAGHKMHITSTETILFNGEKAYPSPCTLEKIQEESQDEAVKRTCTYFNAYTEITYLYLRDGQFLQIKSPKSNSKAGGIYIYKKVDE